MSIKASTLAAAGAAPLLMLGAQALAQPRVAPQNQPSGITLTCNLDRGPRAGAHFDFQGTAAQPAQVGVLCSDMSGSTGVAVAPEIAGQPGQNPRPREGAGRYYQRGPTTSRSTWTCQFTRGPRAGSSIDFAHDVTSNALPVGGGCSDGAGSTGVAVPPNPGEKLQQNEGPY